MKKIISALLAISLLLSYSVTAFADVAGQSEKKRGILSQDDIILLDADKNLVLQVKDDPNGNTQLLLKKDGDLLGSAYIDREKTTITETLYSEKVQVYQNEFVYRENLNSPSKAAASFVSVGRIRYNAYLQGSLVNSPSISVSRAVESGHQPEYYFGGQYATIASLVAALIGAFSIPAAVAATLAATIYSIAGYATSATSIILPIIPVAADWKKVDWKGVNTNSPTQSAVVSGVKYVFTLGNNPNQTQYSGTYYAESSYTSHSTALAYDLFWRIFPNYDSCTVSSWS